MQPGSYYHHHHEQYHDPDTVRVVYHDDHGRVHGYKHKHTNTGFNCTDDECPDSLKSGTGASDELGNVDSAGADRSQRWV